MEFRFKFFWLFFLVCATNISLAQDLSFGLTSEFSMNKFIPSISLEKKIGKKNFIQLTVTYSRFTNSYYPKQIFGCEQEPIFRECIWDLPYPNTVLTNTPISNKVKISGFRTQATYLEYIPFRNKKHKFFWSFSVNLNLLNDQFEAKDSLNMLKGNFKFMAVGTSIRVGYRFVSEHFHSSIFIGPSHYIDLYPGKNSTARYPFVAPFVNLEMEMGVSVAYYLYK